MPGGVNSTSASGSSSKAAAGTLNPALRHVKWSEFPIKHRVVASTRFSEHMLVKVGR